MTDNILTELRELSEPDAQPGSMFDDEMKEIFTRAAIEIERLRAALIEERNRSFSFRNAIRPCRPGRSS